MEDVKEVIEYFENYLKASLLISSSESKQDEMFRRAITLLKHSKECEGIIKSLKAMWGELNTYLSDERRGIATKWILGKMEQIRQKHFPKEGRK